jgi:ABC-type nitrate/sulfonate/bicarbonate transport system ATPase subunit
LPIVNHLVRTVTGTGLLNVRNDTRGNNMASLSQAGRLTGLGKITITRAIKSSWHSATGKLDGEAAEPEPLARQSRSLIPWSSARAQVVTEAELRQRVALVEEKLADLKTALDDMRAQRDAWQAMAQARIRAPVPARSRWSWLRST